MTDEFLIALVYKKKPYNFNAKLLLQGNSHKFKVLIEESEVFFEPDEEGHYRAVIMPWQDSKNMQHIDKHLLGAIQQKIEEILA